MRKWCDMSNQPKTFRDKIDKLERNFAVSTVIFKKFQPIFLDVFINPAQEVPRQHRGSRKQRRFPCTSNELFNFVWTMFVQVKGNFPAISDDLVNSYHLLLCCIDWIYANALIAMRKDLLNCDFEGLPGDFVNWKPGMEVPCIIQILCERHDGLVVEAKTIKEHWWKPYMKRLFERKVLHGKPANLSAVLDVGNFEENVKMISSLYEEYVLSVGDFDERIFLGDDANEEIGTPGGQNTTSDLAAQMQSKRLLKQYFDETISLTHTTPLTGRRYLKEKEPSVTPVSTATQSVSRLQTLLSSSKTSPSDAVLEIFKSCVRNPLDEITNRVKDMGEIFCKHYTKTTDNHGGSTADFGRKRLQLGESLYFKILEAIVKEEQKRLTGGDNKQVNLLALLENEYFHRSLFSCCLEIVIFSYNSQRTFPWIIDIFELSPYHFYKVIEIIIRAEKGLSRDVVKHLNHIEESILESSAWKTDSPLWDAIKETSVPHCGEVMPTTHIENSQPGLAPVARHPRLRSLVGDIKSVIQKATDNNLLSPLMPMAADRFSSPTPGNAKRRLFDSGPTVSVTSNTAVLRSSVTTCGVTIISSANQLPSSNRSILFSQLKGGTSDALIVSNKMASALAPTSTLPIPDCIVSVTTSPSDLSSSSAIVVTAASGNSSILTSSIARSNNTQQAIVAMMEDGRQILIPVQIAQPTASNTTVTSATANIGRKSLIVDTTNTNRKSGQSVIQVVKLEPGEPDDSCKRPTRTGSLGLFFRKVYHLASVRLRDLFDKLDIDDEELLKKIWTCFEYALVSHVNLMCDHHLDQLIMCSMYLITKVSGKPLTFQNIMKCYRLQPQAHSHVYRSVILSGRHRHGSGSSDSNEDSGAWSPVNIDGRVDNSKDKKHVLTVRSSSTLPHPLASSQPPTPTRFADGQTEFDMDEEEERGDLIQFYNLIFLKKIRSFALKFSDKSLYSQEQPKLSPLPAVRCLKTSPRRVSNIHPVFISPHRGDIHPYAHGMSYSFSLSPSKDLQAINKMIRQGLKSSTKRMLEVDKEDSVHSPAKRLASGHPLIRRLQDLATLENP